MIESQSEGTWVGEGVMRRTGMSISSAEQGWGGLGKRTKIGGGGGGVASLVLVRDLIGETPGSLWELP